MIVEAGIGTRGRADAARIEDLRRQRADYANATTSISGQVIYSERIAEIDRQIEELEVSPPQPLNYEEARKRDLQIIADDIDDARDFLIGGRDLQAIDALRFCNSQIRTVRLQIEDRFNNDNYQPSPPHVHPKRFHEAWRKDLLGHYGWLVDGLNQARSENNKDDRKELSPRIDEIRQQLDEAFPRK